MKAVVSHGNDVNFVTFEKRIQDPWAVLAQIAQDCPDVLEKPIQFAKRIPDADVVYTLWEMNGNNTSVVRTAELKEAVKFLKPGRPLRTLGELLAKYAAK